MAGSDLVISVGASIRDLERQLAAAAKVAEKRADEIEGEFKRRNPSFAGDFGLGLLKGAIAGIAFDQITRGIIDANKEIAGFADTARRAGVELGKFQELRLAAQGEGISGKEFDKGIEGLAKQLNDARTAENDLTKYLDANNIKLRDRKGEVIGTNEALAAAADLIAKAATEQDKVNIAEAFGLPKDFVPLLESGAAALAELARKAGEAGSILDADVIAKAKEFDTAWNNAWAAFASNSKAAVLSAAQGLASLAAQASAYLATVNQANAAGSQVSERARRRDEARTMGLANAGGREALASENAAAARAARSSFRSSEIALRNQEVIAPVPPSRPGRGYIGNDVTKIPPKKTGGGGGGGGKSEEDSAQARLDKYIETLMRQNSVLDAEIATFGKSNAEKRAAVELAKAQVDLAKLDEGARQKVIAGLTKEIELSEQKRTQLKSLKDAQDGLRDAQKFFGDAAVDALEDLILNGAKAEDVVKSLTKSLAKAALQATLTGSGPLAGLFGTAGQNGATGGLFGSLFSGTGSLFGRATGGPVNAGQPYRIGERGPETFVPTTPGKIIPNGRAGSGAITLTDQRTLQVIPAQGVTPEQLQAVLAADRAQMASRMRDIQKRAG